MTKILTALKIRLFDILSYLNINYPKNGWRVAICVTPYKIAV